MAAISEHWNFLFLSKSEKFVLAAANDETERQKLTYFLVVEIGKMSYTIYSKMVLKFR